MLATVVAVLVGLALLGLGAWILLLRVEGFVDYLSPGSLTIGQVTIDGKDTKEHAQILRARFDHYFRRSTAIPSETGFLDVVTLDAPDLFRSPELASTAEKIKVEVSGVDVGVILGFVNDVARPPEWVVEADFQNRPDRGVLALRLRRGPRVIRTWYLEHAKPVDGDQALLIERLTDDGIFQLVFDFWSAQEVDSDLFKWRDVIQRPKAGEELVTFPTAASVAAYYAAVGALGRYYAVGAWSDLEAAVEALRTLRIQMPSFEDALKLLGIALAEQRQEGEAIHVFEQLEYLLESRGVSDASHERRFIALLKATAMVRQDTWQTAHEALRVLEGLDGRLGDVEPAKGDAGDRSRALGNELKGHCAVQRALAYALYLDYLRYATVTDVFGEATAAPSDLKLAPGERERLAPHSPDARRTVLAKVNAIAAMHRAAIRQATKASDALKSGGDLLWRSLDDARGGDGRRRDWERRKSELDARLHLAAGIGFYRMAEWERGPASSPDALVFSPPIGDERDPFGRSSLELLERARSELREADRRHPNHYLVLQFLGLAYSEPRDPRADLSVAEQYFERALRANPSDHAGHELLSSILYRRVAMRGIDWGSKGALEEGLAEAQKALQLRETSFIAHLRRAQFQAMRLVLERDAAERRKLWAELEQSCGQAERFMPRAFARAAPELTWVEVVSAMERSREAAERIASAKGGAVDPDAARRFEESAGEVGAILRKLLDQARWYEERWVPNQRRFDVQAVAERAGSLLKQVSRRLQPAEWQRIPIQFPYAMHADAG